MVSSRVSAPVAGMGVDDAPIGDDEALGAQRLQAGIVGAGRDRAFDASGEQLLECGEQDVLQVDGERQQPVQEGGDRRQLVLDAVGIHQLQAGRVLERLERATLHLAANKQMIELTQRVAAVMAFEIVLGPEQALAAGLALAAGDRAQRVEPAGDRGEKALFRLHVGRDRPEQRRLRLVGAVGAAQALDGGVRLPAGLEQVVDPQPAIPRRQFGVVAAARAAGIAEDKDALGVIHEGGGLGEVGRGCAVLDDEAVAPYGRRGASVR